GRLELALRQVPGTSYDVEDRRRRPGRAVEGDRDLVREHAGEVGGQPAAGDVRHRVRVGGLGEGEARPGVDPGGLEELLAQCAAQLGDLALERPAQLVEEDVPD